VAALDLLEQRDVGAELADRAADRGCVGITRAEDVPGDDRDLGRQRAAAFGAP
jgi:hypothetical protein